MQRVAHLQMRRKKGLEVYNGQLQSGKDAAGPAWPLSPLTCREIPCNALQNFLREAQKADTYERSEQISQETSKGLGGS